MGDVGEGAVAGLVAELAVDEGGDAGAEVASRRIRAGRRAGSHGLGPAAGGPVRERGAQLRPAAVDAAADGAELDAQRRRDLLVGQALDVAEHDGGAEVRRQGVERALHVVVEVRVVVDLRRAPARGRAAARRRRRRARRSGSAACGGPCRGTGWW